MKRLVLITLLFFTTKSLSALDMRLGLHLAPSIAWLKSNTNGVSSDGPKLGFTYGATVDFPFAENYSIGLGADVTYRGGYLKADVPFAPQITYDLQNFEVPITLKMKTNKIGQFVYYGQFGVGAGFNLKSNESVNTFGLALIIGAGLEVPISGNTAFTTGLCFNNGFTDVIEGNGKAITNYLSLNLGILF